MRLLLALALLAPTAAALDAFPSETHWGARDASFVVRAAPGPLNVSAPPGVNVTTLERDWHGLAGATAMRATRPDGALATIDITDASGTGVELVWPADEPPAHALPAPLWLALAGGAAAALLASRR